MGNRAFVLGYGQIGRAVSANLAAHGWDVVVGTTHSARPDDSPASDWSKLDRNVFAELDAAIGDRVDAVIDTVAFDAAHAAQWHRLTHTVGKLVVISSISVYADDAGRTLDEAWTNRPPRFAFPIPENNRRVAPGPETYSTRKVALEDAVMALPIPSVIVRPGAIYGIGSRSPREWWFIQQALADRQRIPLAWNGASQFHPVAAENIAEIVRLAIAAPGSHVLNACDMTCPTAGEVGQAILAAMGSTSEIDPFEGPPRGFEGLSPWTIPHPMVAATTAARQLGYHPVTSFSESVSAVTADLIERGGRHGWKLVFPGLAAYPHGFFLD